MEKIVRPGDRPKKGKLRKRRVVHETSQYDKDRLLLYARRRVSGSWEDVAKFWNSVHNLEQRDAQYLEERHKKVSKPLGRRPSGWTSLEKLLLLRIVYDTIVLQYETARENESGRSNSELQKHPNETGTSPSPSQGLERTNKEEMQRKQTIQVLEKVLQPYLSATSEKAGPTDLFPSINEDGIETKEEPLTCSTVRILEQEIRAGLKGVTLKVIDWDHVLKIWNGTEGCQKRSIASLRDMFCKLRKGKA